ncbi:integrin beta-like protein C isoform X2 [Embiotoca jacksoni]|uniref:integrin beta-like protein C isoform X2 n=1 Tax=Embiotoca jacksoni TaxID=100190 RepID=UPI00370490F6
MLLSGLLLLLVCSTQASHFYGTVITYYPKNTNADGSVTVVLRYKLNFHSCTNASWACLSGNCGNESVIGGFVVDTEDSGNSIEWCQTETISTRLVPSNAPFLLVFASSGWIQGIKNGIVSWRAITLVELKNRSDTGRANSSPQTTMLPAVRVPSNCQRDFDLLAFDPDGDEVKCRYGNDSLFECNPCTPPSVLSLSPSCTLSFRPTNSSNEGPYAVQLVMEDFPRQTISLTQTNGLQEVKTTSDAISKIPLQFVVRVDPAVPSCTEGLYLPKFLPPTPANRAQLYTAVNHKLEITINAEATNSTIPTVLFSGPINVAKNTSGSGRFTLTWTPSEREDGESHPVCFVVQALYNTIKYHSELRCVIVNVGIDLPINMTAPPINSTVAPTTITTQTTSPTTNLSNTIVVGLRMKISTSLPLTEETSNIFSQKLKEELMNRGLPSSIEVFVGSFGTVEVTTPAG